MNSFSLAKFFTVVSVVVFSGLNHANAQSTSNSGALSESGEKAYLGCISDANSNPACQSDPDSKSCKTLLDRCEAGRKSLSGTNNGCAPAMKEWRDKASKGQRACSAFDSSLGKTCEQKMAACEKKKNGTFGGDNEDVDQTTQYLQQIVMGSIGTSSTDIANDALNGGKACVKQYSAKTKKEEEKEFNKEKRDLTDKVNKKIEEITKQNEELKKKQTSIQKDIDEIQAKAKTEKNDRDVKLRKSTEEYTKSTLDSAKKLRAMDDEIFNLNQQVAKANYNFQKNLLALTDDKITAQCKQQVLSVRAALLSSGTPSSGSTSADSKQLEALRAQMGTGAKGTANLNAYLKQIKDACFLESDTKRKDLQQQNSQAIDSLNKQLKNRQDDIAEEKKRLQVDKQSSEAAKSESDTAQTAADKERTDKLNTLNKELTDFQDTVNEKIKNAKKEQAELQKEIEDLTLKKNFDVEPAYDDAADAINEAENARVSAVQACQCNDSSDDSSSDSKTVSDNCTMLAKQALDYDSSKSRRSGKTKSAK